MAESKSISFDRAAGYYDRTRALPDELMARVVDALVAELPRDGRCLEIGIGTGRIALPLVKQNVRIVGVDISREMLRRLVDNAAPSAPPPLVQADASRLPFPNARFAAATAVHVMHLVPPWKEAAAELLRVVRPGGPILVTGRPKALRESGGRADAWDERVYRRFFEEAGDPPWPPGMDGLPQLDEHMRPLGVTVRELPGLQVDVTSTINEVVDHLEAGYASACWTLDDKTRRHAASRARAWARSELGDLDEPRTTREGMTWHVYRLRK